MSKPTIFGEENFLDTSMIKIVEMRNEAVDNFILEEMENGVRSIGLKFALPTVVIDKKKLANWIKLCSKLDNIDKSDLIDMTTRKRFLEKNHELAVMKKALELAVSKVNWCPAKQGECSCSEHKRDCSTYFINQAKEMLKDVKD